MAGLFSSFFKHKKPKQFKYKPLYFNEEKEAMEKRIKRIEKEVELETRLENDDFKKMLHEKWRKNYSRIENRTSNLRIILIAALLALICYFLLTRF